MIMDKNLQNLNCFELCLDISIAKCNSFKKQFYKLEMLFKARNLKNNNIILIFKSKKN